MDYGSVFGHGAMLVLYRVLALQSLPSDAPASPKPILAGLKLAPSQLKVAKYLVVVAALVAFQTLVGALTAHYFVEPRFFGIEVQKYLPFNIARTWHVATAVYWIATAWLAAGLFIAPLVGHEHSGLLRLLALGLLLFVLRSIVRPEAWSDRPVTLSFWLINLGLLFQLIFDLIPVGFMQLAVSYDKGAWYARSFDFLNSPVVRTFIWLRLPGDAIFILGALTLLYVTVRGAFNLRRATVEPGEGNPG